MRRLVLVGVLALAPGLAAAAPAGGMATGVVHRPMVVIGANQSNNWSGYVQGTLEQPSPTLFSQVSSDWVVPTATQATPGQAESSSNWIGIGGGCVDATCTVTDNTLIQTGTEQDVSAAGVASYSAWYELVPAPSLTVSVTVHPGDRMHADIHEAVASTNVWVITITDSSTGQSFTTTVPYSSSKGSVESIQETPLSVGTGGAGLTSMPNLSGATFDNALRNSANPNLKASEQIDLVSSTGSVVSAPSGPDTDTDGFGVCTYGSIGSCSPPAS